MASNLVCVLALAEIEGASPKGFDVNDVVFVLPMTSGKQPQIYPEIPLSTLSYKDHQPLVSDQLLEQILLQVVTQSELTKKAEVPWIKNNLRVTALRYDPCAPVLTEDTRRCVQQIRLIVQPISPRGFARDLSLHFIFDVGKGLPAKDSPFLLQLAQIQRLSRQSGGETTGQALGIHPGLQFEIQNKTSQLIGQKVLDFVVSNVSGAHLSEVTAVDGDSDSGMSGAWIFFGGPVRNAVWTLAPIPRAKGTKPVLSQQTDSNGDVTDIVGIRPQVTPASERPDPPKVDEMLDVQKLLNPNLTHPKNTDCGSCHVASVRALQLDFSPFAANSVFSETYQTPVGITGFVDPRFRSSEGFSDVRVIGRLERHVTVTAMIANSAAAVADTLNRIRGLENPNGLDCRSPVVRLCFNGVSSSGTGAEATAEDCLKLCQKAR